MAGKSGRPVATEPKITEQDWPEIYRLWVRGTSPLTIGKKYNVTRQTVCFHLQRIRNEMRGTLVRTRDEVLDELAEVRFAAWAAFDKSKAPITHDQVTKELAAAAAGTDAERLITGDVVKQVSKIVSRTAEPTWLNVIVAAIQEENRIVGRYEVAKVEALASAAGQAAAYRVAGTKPTDLVANAMEGLAKALARRATVLHAGDN